MKINRKWIFGAVIVVVLALSACGKSTNNENPANTNHNSHNSMDGMNHSSSGEVPAGLEEAKNPTFKVGSQATMNTDHMEGMNGANATIAGAYSTTVYAVSYSPTTGGEKVTHHKWVIHEELKNAGEEPFKPGDKVVLQAEHMEGMDGAEATIDSAEQTTVYMVDYMPATGGEMVKNHKWVTESELSSAGTTGG
ncbi:YdhK family protein [Paenibacillus nasutitermitis]|nr:YdhK family protein [Paenibacillus nasutitermitis]